MYFTTQVLVHLGLISNDWILDRKKLRTSAIMFGSVFRLDLQNLKSHFLKVCQNIHILFTCLYVFVVYDVNNISQIGRMFHMEIVLYEEVGCSLKNFSCSKLVNKFIKHLRSKCSHYYLLALKILRNKN